VASAFVTLGLEYVTPHEVSMRLTSSRTIFIGSLPRQVRSRSYSLAR
jgi:hypothetical protein